MQRLILASASPRRRELLAMLGLTDFEVIPARGEPSIPVGAHPADAVARIARYKAETVADQNPGALVLAADTVVALDGRILGKPAGAADAAEMLRALSGREHAVYTGVALLCGARALCRTERTAVHFRPLTDGEIAAYIATGEPLDKAGAYGAQGRGSLFVERIEGDFFNVVGLPLCLLGKLLEEFGFNLMEQGR